MQTFLLFIENNFKPINLDGHFPLQNDAQRPILRNVSALLSICRPSGCTVVSGVVFVGVCNCSQMRTSKFTCIGFGVNIGLDPG